MYSDERMDGVRQRQTAGGSVKELLVKKKNQMLEVIKSRGMTNHCEALYARKPRNSKLKGGVKSVIKADVQNHGFKGYLGLCPGHELLGKETLLGEHPVVKKVMEMVDKGEIKFMEDLSEWQMVS